jgi:predicted permease
MEIPLLKGREFNEHDQHRSTPVIIVSEGFAQKHFPGEDPIGKRIKPGVSSYEGEKSTMREIVGVVGNVKNRGLNVDVRPTYYTPISQIPFTQMAVLVKTNGDPRALISASRNEVSSIDRELPVFNVKTMDDYLSASVASPRFNTTLLGIFAAVALILTIVGLYGVMSYSVAQRTNEIGIRMALGAQTRDVLKMIVSQGFKLVLLGLGIGLIGAFAITRIIASLLFGVSTKDPLTFAAAGLVLSAVALIADWASRDKRSWSAATILAGYFRNGL